MILQSHQLGFRQNTHFAESKHYSLTNTSHLQ